MTFETPPTATGVETITMMASTATDINGVEYFFECLSPGGNDSGWQDSPTYTDSGLSPSTEYSYRVTARDKSPAQTSTAASTPASATTMAPDLTNPLVSSFSPPHQATKVAVDSVLVVTFDENIMVGSGNVTLRNLTDGMTGEIVIDINDADQISVSGAVLSVSPTADLLEGKTYAVQIGATTIIDMVGNNFAGITDDVTWTFKTPDPLPPGVVFADDFEAGENPYGGTTPDVSTYTVANTSGQANTTLWVRATSGFNSTRNGLIDESENGGANFTDPIGSQAYGLRYTNSGLTSAAGRIGTLTEGITYNVSFDVVADGFNAGTAYNAMLVLFDDGATRNATEQGNKNTAAVLAQKSGTVANDGNYHTFTLSYTTGDNVVDNNGATAGTSTAFLSSLLGKDIAIRFVGATSSSNIDNVRMSTVGGEGPGPVDHFVISPITSPQTVGTPITGITITAQDAANETATSFTGTVTFGGTGWFLRHLSKLHRGRAERHQRDTNSRGQCSDSDGG